MYVCVYVMLSVGCSSGRLTHNSFLPFPSEFDLRCGVEISVSVFETERLCCVLLRALRRLSQVITAQALLCDRFSVRRHSSSVMCSHLSVMTYCYISTNQQSRSRADFLTFLSSYIHVCERVVLWFILHVRTRRWVLISWTERVDGVEAFNSCWSWLEWEFIYAGH